MSIAPTPQGERAEICDFFPAGKIFEECRRVVWRSCSTTCRSRNSFDINNLRLFVHDAFGLALHRGTEPAYGGKRFCAPEGSSVILIYVLSAVNVRIRKEASQGSSYSVFSAASASDLIRGAARRVHV